MSATQEKYRIIDSSSGGVSHRTMIKAMLQCKCPICQQGDMFKTKATNLVKFNELNEKCGVCGFRFMPEPGFYQISLYVSYAVNVAIFLVMGAATYLLLDNPPLWVYYLTIIGPSLLAVPWNLRYSKVVMLYALGGVWSRQKNTGKNEKKFQAGKIT